MLALPMAAARGQPADAPVAGDWPADAASCLGLYAAIAAQKSSLIALSPVARDTPGLEAADFAERRAVMRARRAPDAGPDSSADRQLTFATLLGGALYDSDSDAVVRLLQAAVRCDQAHGFPAFGPVGGERPPAMAVAAAAPAPPPPPVVVASAPAPAPAPAPAMSLARRAVQDRACAVAYLSVGLAVQQDQTLAATLLDRANGAGLRYAEANPTLGQPAIAEDVQSSAVRRIEAILGGKAPMDPLLDEASACDAKYGHPRPRASASPSSRPSAAVAPRPSGR